MVNKLNIRPSKFTIYVKKRRDNSFQELRGRQEKLEIKQKIYHRWIKNAINTTDGRNGLGIVKISKRKYFEQYGTITDSNINIEEFKNKHGQTYLSANRMVITQTVRSILQRLTKQGVTPSYGAMLS